MFKQDYPCIEYIICDDGSDNFPEKEINDYFEKNKSKNIISYKIIHNNKNLGTVKNINNAYRISSGDYIFNLSCGDVFFETCTVRKIYKRFTESKCKVLVTSRILYENKYKYKYLLPHYDERRIIKQLDNNKKQYAAFVTSCYYDMASGSAMYFTRDVLDEFGYFDEKYILWEDGPFLAKYLYKYPLGFAHDIISIWYEDGGVSSKNSTIHPFMKKDIDIFYNVERLIHIKELKRSDQLKLIFLQKKHNCSSKLNKIKLYIRYFPQVLFYYVKNKKRKLRVRKDRKVITQIMKESKSVIGDVKLI